MLKIVNYFKCRWTLFTCITVLLRAVVISTCWALLSCSMYILWIVHVNLNKFDLIWSQGIAATFLKRDENLLYKISLKFKLVCNGEINCSRVLLSNCNTARNAVCKLWRTLTKLNSTGTLIQYTQQLTPPPLTVLFIRPSVRDCKSLVLVFTKFYAKFCPQFCIRQLLLSFITPRRQHTDTYTRLWNHKT